MTAVECNNKDCYYNLQGFCDSEIVEIKDGRCITPEVDKELGVFDESC